MVPTAWATRWGAGLGPVEYDGRTVSAGCGEGGWLSGMARTLPTLGFRKEDRQAFRPCAGSLGTRYPEMRFVAAANIGTYTCAANMGPPCPPRLREHESRS